MSFFFYILASLKIIMAKNIKARLSGMRKAFYYLIKLAK